MDFRDSRADLHPAGIVQEVCVGNPADQSVKVDMVGRSVQEVKVERLGLHIVGRPRIGQRYAAGPQPRIDRSSYKPQLKIV